MYKKVIFSTIFISIVLSICYFCKDSNLQGFYQSNRTSDGYILQLMFNDENYFELYIDNRKVDYGSYEEVGERKYILNGKNETMNVSLSKNDSFNLLLKNINEGSPIKLKNINKTPVSFSTQFDDTDEYLSIYKK